MEKLIKNILEKSTAFYLNAHYSIDTDNDVTRSIALNMADELIDRLNEYINLLDEDEDSDPPEEESLIRFQNPDEKHLRG